MLSVSSKASYHTMRACAVAESTGAGVLFERCGLSGRQKQQQQQLQRRQQRWMSALYAAGNSRPSRRCSNDHASSGQLAASGRRQISTSSRRQIKWENAGRCSNTLTGTGDFRQQHFDEQLFNLMSEEDGRVPVSRLLNALNEAGLWRNDPRLVESLTRIRHYSRDAPTLLPQQPSPPGAVRGPGGEILLDRASFRDCVRQSATLIRRALTGDLVIPEFGNFCKSIGDIYADCKKIREGKVASYIPQLARFSPDYWGVSLCTVDGQRKSFGDVEGKSTIIRLIVVEQIDSEHAIRRRRESKIPFTIQSGGKPSMYALAVNDLGSDFVHKHVGHEPSGESFNFIKLSPENKPHNPLVNAGAIVITSLIKRELSPSDRFDYTLKQYGRLVGGEFLGFNNAVFLSEKETAHRNFALGHYMMENGCFPENTNLEETLDFYFQLCSVEINVNSGAVMAATLANGGFCPITGEEVLSPTSVRNTLSLMHSCGMYDYSGGFAFKVGLPAKSAVSGAILLVVPNVMGMCLWSPPLERMGNSVRGVAFAERLVQEFNFHHYDNVRHVYSNNKKDPRLRRTESIQAGNVVNLLFGAYNGDLTSLRLMALSNNDMAAADYDGRTALHLAASEGHLDCVQFLVDKCRVDIGAVDRWGRTALDDATKFNREDVKNYLAEKYMGGVISDNEGDSVDSEKTQQ